MIIATNHLLPKFIMMPLDTGLHCWGLNLELLHVRQ
jgi:hypothetical protein